MLWVEIHPTGQTTGSPYPRIDRAFTRTVYFLSRDNIPMRNHSLYCWRISFFFEMTIVSFVFLFS